MGTDQRLLPLSIPPPWATQILPGFRHCTREVERVRKEHNGALSPPQHNFFFFLVLTCRGALEQEHHAFFYAAPDPNRNLLKHIVISYEGCVMARVLILCTLVILRVRRQNTVGTASRAYPPSEERMVKPTLLRLATVDRLSRGPSTRGLTRDLQVACCNAVRHDSWPMSQHGFSAVSTYGVEFFEQVPDRRGGGGHLTESAATCTTVSQYATRPLENTTTSSHSLACTLWSPSVLFVLSNNASGEVQSRWILLLKPSHHHPAKLLCSASTHVDRPTAGDSSRRRLLAGG